MVLREVLGGMLYAIFAAVNSVRLGLLYQKTLGIRFREIGRYWGKCFNLGLCYAAFANNQPVRAALRSGKAAFLSCAYDVVSDWRGFHADSQKACEIVLNELVSQRCVGLAMSLLEQDRCGALADDGLERGVLALEFIVETIGSREMYSRRDLKHLGTILQIVDDVLDLEGDLARGEENCLLGERRHVYLHSVVENSGFLTQAFGHSIVMRLVFRFAGRKARDLLAAEAGMQDG